MSEPLIRLRALASLKDLSATAAFARALAPLMQAGMKIYLSGDLGAGKTALVRELLRALGHSGSVKSPTFTLMEPYNLSKFELHHFDFYRLSEPDAWREAGFEESFSGSAVAVVEWPENAGGSLPPPDLHLRIDIASDDSEDERRHMVVQAHSEAGLKCLNALLEGGFCAREPSRA